MIQLDLSHASATYIELKILEDYPDSPLVKKLSSIRAQLKKENHIFSSSYDDEPARKLKKFTFTANEIKVLKKIKPNKCAYWGGISG